MSFSLNITGHVADDEELSAAVDELLQAKGAEIVAALQALGDAPAFVNEAVVTGPSGTVNYFAVPVDDA